jgi:hypothetical protein
MPKADVRALATFSTSHNVDVIPWFLNCLCLIQAIAGVGIYATGYAIFSCNGAARGSNKFKLCANADLGCRHTVNYSMQRRQVDLAKDGIQLRHISSTRSEACQRTRDSLLPRHSELHLVITCGGLHRASFARNCCMCFGVAFYLFIAVLRLPDLAATGFFTVWPRGGTLEPQAVSVAPGQCMDT